VARRTRRRLRSARTRAPSSASGTGGRSLTRGRPR
jgi:hypothetical protein